MAIWTEVSRLVLLVLAGFTYRWRSAAKSPGCWLVQDGLGWVGRALPHIALMFPQASPGLLTWVPMQGSQREGQSMQVSLCSKLAHCPFCCMLLAKERNKAFPGSRGGEIDSTFLCVCVCVWLFWVFAAACGLSLVAGSRGYSSLWCGGFSLWLLLLLRSTGSRHVGFSSCGSRALEHKLSSCGAWA